MVALYRKRNFGVLNKGPSSTNFPLKGVPETSKLSRLYFPCNISNPTMRTGLDFKSAQFDQVRGEAEDWVKMRGLEI
jgi:hypothetical protein